MLLELSILCIFCFLIYKGVRMKKMIFAVLGLTLMIYGKAGAYDDGDFQIWHTQVQEKEINKEARVTLEEEFRFGDDANDFYYHHYDAGFVYSLNKNLNLGMNYRQVYEKKKGKFKEENRPHINATLKWDLLGLKFEDRNRLQYRHFDYQGDIWQYRNKFSAKFPWKFTKMEIQPYFADEIFLDLQNKAFTRNRFYSGFAIGLNKNLKGEIYYLLQSGRSANKWVDTNVFGAKVKLIF